MSEYEPIRTNIQIMLLKYVICFVFVFINTLSQAQKLTDLRSPDGKIQFVFRIKEGKPFYKILYKDKVLIDESELSLTFKEGGTFGEQIVAGKSQISEKNEDYQLVVGKTKNVHSHYRELVLPLYDTGKAISVVNLAVRVFDDGVAFRYEFPKQKQKQSFTITDENTTFRISGDPKIRALFWSDFNNHHEGLYQKMNVRDIPRDTLIDMPALFEFSDGMYMAITEADLRNYAGMYLKKVENHFVSQLSPHQGQKEVKVNATFPHQSPWRVLMIADHIGKLVETNLLTSLCEPTQIQDLAWIKPGKTSFHWWNGDIMPDTTFAPGANFETNKYYIDFCARNNIEYHSIIGYGGFPWYTSNGFSYGDGESYADVTKPVPSLEMEKICNYAKQKGVGIHVWVHWKALYRNLDSALTQFEKWGVNGMMVDFLERDDQEMVNIQEEILKKSASHKIFVQFHGAYKPTGLSRTYPNEFTREGTFNYEQNKWSKEPISAGHDLDIVFTRLLAGATDYHLGGFHAVSASKFKTQYTRPLMGGTRCHMLAMYVVLESYLQMVADYPSNYEGEEGFEFLQQVPTVWNETKVLQASIDEYITVARRKNQDWYIGSINTDSSRTLSIKLDFLPEGKYIAEIYEDSKEAELLPNEVVKHVEEVNNKTILQVGLAAGGGNAIRIVKTEN